MKRKEDFPTLPRRELTEEPSYQIGYLDGTVQAVMGVVNYLSIRARELSQKGQADTAIEVSNLASTLATQILQGFPEQEKPEDQS